VQFIERLFGLAPDAGSGLLEFILVAILLSLLAVLAGILKASKHISTLSK